MKNNKSLGQHWLKNRAILDEIADLTTADGVDLCLEIGPGLGTLTSSLLKRFKRVIAVEFDPELARKLPASFPGKDLTVINQDILHSDIPALIQQATASNLDSATNADEAVINAADTAASTPAYCIAGNIPYYITSPIVKKVLQLAVKPAKIVLLMQKEVAERIAADSGDYNSLALFVQNLAEVELGPVVKAAEFTPPPKVDSQVLILTPLAEPQIDAKCLALAQRGFASPRKKLAGVLADGTHSREDWRNLLRAQGINSDCRAQDLSLWDWEALYQATSVSSKTAES